MATEKQKQRAWNEADTIAGESPERWRRDRLGNRIRKGSFGTRGTYAWVVGYRDVVADGAAGAPPGRRLEALHAAAKRPQDRTTQRRPVGVGGAAAPAAMARYLAWPAYAAPTGLRPQALHLAGSR